MSVLFIDSSALVKWYRKELGSQWVSELLDHAEKLLISRLTVVEVESALVRRARSATVSSENVQLMINNFESDIQKSFDLIELDEVVMEYALVMVRKHGLRGADAVQLASGVLAQHEIPNAKFIFLSSDSELNTAAIAEGLQVENPNLHP
jgi:hypothetical protein